MRNEEIAEALTGSTESLQEELEYADWILSRTHPLARVTGDRRTEWVEYRDQVAAEIASRG